MSASRPRKQSLVQKKKKVFAHCCNNIVSIQKMGLRQQKQIKIGSTGDQK